MVAFLCIRRLPFRPCPPSVAHYVGANAIFWGYQRPGIIVVVIITIITIIRVITVTIAVGVIFSFVRFAGFHLSGTVLDARPNSPTQTAYAATEPDKKLKKVSVSFDR